MSRTQVELDVLAQLRHQPSLSVSETAADWVTRNNPLLAPSLQASMQREVVANLSGLGVLEPFVNDSTITDVMVAAGKVWIERNGHVNDTGLRLDEPAVLRIVERVIAPVGLQLNRANPMVDARLADGSRLNAIIPPLSIDGTALTIRRFSANTIPLSGFTADESLQLALQHMVAQRKNIVVCGSTGSGKTTLLNSLSSICAPTERIITIEDAAELRLPGEHIVRLEARPGSQEGQGRVGIRELVRNALRMRPDRIVVGEVRGGEALDMIIALNTGHSGSMTTVHANSATDALRRLELMMLLAGIELPMSAVREQIAAAIDIVVHVERDHDGVRRISEVGHVRAAANSLMIDPVDGST